MKQPYSRAFLERSIDRYIRALDSGDLDEIAIVLQSAERDDELDQIIEEVNLAYAEEMGFSSASVESAQIRTLLQEHFPSAFGQLGKNQPITVSEVAAHLVDDQGRERLIGHVLGDHAECLRLRHHLLEHRHDVGHG